MGRTVRVSRPSMRGSPSRIRERTIFDSSVKQTSLTACPSGPFSAPTPTSVKTRCQILSIVSDRACFCFNWNAAHRSASASLAILSARAVSLCTGAQSHAVTPASSASSLIALTTACSCWWPYMTAPSITSSGNSVASDSTISTACCVPATTRFNWVCFSSVAVGFST